MFVVPAEKESINVGAEGMKYPIATPTAIARKIQSVRKRSRKERCFRSYAGAQLFADIRGIFVQNLLNIFLSFHALWQTPALFLHQYLYALKGRESCGAV